jgi:sugar phosphate isomerase/epimerase
MTMAGTTRRGVLAAAGTGLASGVLRLPEASAQQLSGGEPPFHLGTVTYNVPKDWDLATLLNTLPQAGLTGIEFRTTHAHGVEPSLSASQRGDVKQRCADAGLKQWSLGTVCEFQSTNPEEVRKHVESCREWVALAKEIGALGVKVRPNGMPEGEKSLEQIGKALRECGAFAQDAGVEIWMEVHGKDTQVPANSKRIMDHCGHRSVGICWNSNPTDVENGSVRAAFELLKPHLMSVHINDLWGPYPYRELFALLRQANFRRHTYCEVGTPVKAEDGLLFFRCYHGLWRELARG